ncbi:MAG: S8 family serine peptidase [Nanoarchaeota archaeon]
MQKEVRGIISVFLFIIFLFILSTTSELPQIPSNKADALETNLFTDLNKEFEKYFSIWGYAAAQLAPGALDDVVPQETPKTIIEEPIICTPEWSCDEWSECTDNIQTRNCIDLNNCGTFENKPSEERFCEEVEIQKEEPPLIQQPTSDIFPYGQGLEFGQDLQFQLDNRLHPSTLLGQEFNLLTDSQNIIFSENALELNQDGWIIQLKNKEPAAVLKKQGKKTVFGRKEATTEDILQQKREIWEEQNKVISKISAIDPKIKVRNRFYTVYSGFSADFDKSYLEKIKNIPDIEIFPNLKVEATLYESVPLINADDVWKLDKDGNPCTGTIPITGRQIYEGDANVMGGECITGKGVTIGIIDTGVDYTHVDLGGCFGENCKVIDGYDFVNDDNDPIDDMGHGTHVAATAAGDGTAADGTILKGVAPDANIVAYKVLNAGGYGYSDDVIAAIERSSDPDRD